MNKIFKFVARRFSLFAVFFAVCCSLLTVDCFSQWQQISGASDSVILCLASKDSNIFAGTWQTGILLSTNNGTNWTNINNGLGNNASIFSLTINGSNIFAGTDVDGLFLSTNNGSYWHSLNNGINNNFVTTVFISGSEIFAGTWGGVFVSTNNGLNWTKMNNGLNDSTEITSITISGTNVIAGTYNQGIYLSSNNGLNWVSVNQGLTTNCILSLAIMDSTFFAGTSKGVFISTNNGIKWYLGSNDLSNIQTLLVKGSDIYAGTYNEGLFLSKDKGKRWSKVNQGLTNSNVLSLIYKDSFIFAGTWGAGVWKRSISEILDKTIQGNLTYDNKFNTPLKNIKLYLKDSTDKIIDSTITDTTGHYIFHNVINGKYTLLPTPNTLPAWGGVNPIDALLINRTYISLNVITDNLLKTAADVNGDNKINPLDALLINRRYIHIINKFTVPDWLFDNLNVTVNGDDITHNIKAVCAGDVNGSYIPK